MKSSIFVFFLLLVTCYACNNGEPSPKDMYFGGLIVNPTSNFVVLLKQDKVVDTFYLNNKNQFGGKLNTADKGLYVFKHPPENQIMYMEPGDSTLVLLNTLEFDESINFSGKGAEKSNYLNKMYLQNQANNNFILSYYQLDPVDFAKKTDSIRSHRQKNLDKLNNKHRFSDEFYNLASASINYEYYDLRERYAFLLRKYSYEDIKKIPDDFHNYREEISFNDEDLEYYYVYLNFLDDLIRTKSMELCEVKEKHFACDNPGNFKNTSRRIVLTDSLISNLRIKNNFIDRYAAQGIIYSQSTADLVAILELLKEIDYSGDRMDDLRQMAGIQNSLLPGNSIGELVLLNTGRDTVKLKEISARPKITYHWSMNSQGHYQWLHNTIEELRVKYPEVDFVGINIDKNHFSEWQNIIKNQEYNEDLEYKLNILRINEDLLKNYLNKLLFLKPSGEVVRGDVQINTLDYESKIVEFLDSIYLGK